jgi:hypothetical protein
VTRLATSVGLVSVASVDDRRLQPTTLRLPSSHLCLGVRRLQSCDFGDAVVDGKGRRGRNAGAATDGTRAALVVVRQGN